MKRHINYIFVILVVIAKFAAVAQATGPTTCGECQHPEGKDCVSDCTAEQTCVGGSCVSDDVN